MHSKKTLEDLGYQVFYEVLNAKSFGLPQNRERIYIVAFLREAFTNPIAFNFASLKELRIESRVGDILENNVDKKYTISNRLWQGHQRRKKGHRLKGNGFGYSLFNADSSHTSTISARYYKDGSEILIEQKCRNPRKPTPREAGRLQGFRDDFKIVVSDTQAYKQFGNSVAIAVVERIADMIRMELYSLLFFSRAWIMV